MQIPELDYWKLRAALNEPAAIEAEARLAAEQFKQRIAQAQQQARDLLVKAGCQPSKNYRWNDATCELIEIPSEVKES